LKPKHFGKCSDISEESFKILLNEVSDKNHAEFVAENFGWVIMPESRLFL